MTQHKAGVMGWAGEPGSIQIGIISRFKKIKQNGVIMNFLKS